MDPSVPMSEEVEEAEDENAGTRLTTQKATIVAPGNDEVNAQLPGTSEKDGFLPESDAATVAGVAITASHHVDGEHRDFSETGSKAREKPVPEEILPVLISDGDDLQSDSSSSIVSMEHKAARRRGKDMKLEADRLSQGRFVRSQGNIYVADAYWERCMPAADDCYLYVSSSAPNANSSMTVEELRAQGTGLPLRFKVVNEALYLDMVSVAGSPPTPNIQTMPYRSLFLHEHKYRQRLHELESECPNSPRSRDRTECILKGYQTLIHFLDTDLHELVQNRQRIESNTIEKLPFLQLWHLFTPGKEICTRQPVFQIHRVLQVTGGRKLMTSVDYRRIPPRPPRDLRAEEFYQVETSHVSQHRRSTADLIIDCFHLEFDGTEFKPVSTVLQIKPYDGERAVLSLPVYPLALVKSDLENEISSLAELLLTRGKKYEVLTQPSHRRYNGLSVFEEGAFETPEEVSTIYSCFATHWSHTDLPISTDIRLKATL